MEEHIEIARWGRDHWSTFAYIEVVQVDYKGKIANERMRCNPRLHRGVACFDAAGGLVVCESPTILKDGQVDKHDDWSCVEDMENEGLLTYKQHTNTSRQAHGNGKYDSFGFADIVVTLTEKGWNIAQQLRQHKAQGGDYSNFVPKI